MNVNLWGPDLWSILHGISGLAVISDAFFEESAPLSIFKELCVLLPCVHCRKSYCDFFQESECLESIKNKALVAYAYKMHCLVDDKLESQRLDRLFEQVKVDESISAQIRNASSLLSTRPSLQVVMKRWELSEGKPFAETSVWRCLFAFVMLVDNDLNPSIRRASIIQWISSLSSFLKSSLEYKALGAKLSRIAFPQEFSSKEGFNVLALARESLLPLEVSRKTLMKKKEEESPWLKPLWQTYKNNLPAGACGKFTCA